MLTLVNIFNVFKYGFTGFFLFIDSIVYWLVCKLFYFYDSIAKVEFIKNSDYTAIADKFYVIIGIVMLFYLSYSLLKSLINPDDLNKNLGKIVTNLIVSLILLGVVPILFSYAFQIQNAVIQDNIIGNLVLGTGSDDNIIQDNSISKQGGAMAVTILSAFLNPGGEDVVGEGKYNWKNFFTDIFAGSVGTAIIENKLEHSISGDGVTWEEFVADASSGNANAFFDITAFAEPVSNGEAEYTPIISTICGAFLAYVLISFSIDLGIRVVKLAFYQIIAPIPILMRVIPEKKSVFDNWIKGTLATFMEVFIRLFIMFIVVLLAILVLNPERWIDNGLNIFGSVLVVMGIFAFAKQAPKLISDVIGIDSGNIKLGIGGKLATGGAFGLGAILGGGLTLGTRNLTHGIKNAMIAEGGWNKFKAIARTPGSMGAGLIGGAYRSGKGGFSAKNFKDMRTATSQGIKEGTDFRDKRERYRLEHGDNLKGVMKGHINDIGTGIKGWATGSLAGILEKVKLEEQFKELYDDYQAIYETAQYKSMDTELQRMKALQASGQETLEGTPNGTKIVDAIKNLEGKMLESRMDSMRKNKQSAAYAMYNIAQMAKQNPSLAKDLKIDVSMADDLELRAGKIYSKSNGKLIDDSVNANKLFSIIEGSALAGVSYDSASETYRDARGAVADLAQVAVDAKELKDGMAHQKKLAADAIKADKISIEYKEAMKKQDAANKK